MLRRTTFSIVAAVFAMGALAHDHEDVTEGTLLEVEPEERQITVLLADGSTNDYKVAEDAVITTFDGVREREHDFYALTPGVTVELEFEGEGENMSVRSLNTRSGD